MHVQGSIVPARRCAWPTSSFCYAHALFALVVEVLQMLPPTRLAPCAARRANKRIISFSCLLCMMALFNALIIPLHLEDRILQHPESAVMHVAGRLPDWQDHSTLLGMQQGLRNGSLKLGESLTRQQAAARFASNSTGDSSRAAVGTAVDPEQQLSAAAARVSYSWQGEKESTSWAADAVGRLAERVQLYQGEARGCPDVERLRRNLLKHHDEIARMQVGWPGADG
jgi:hypothetical protein